MTNYMYGFDTANYQRGINMAAMKAAGARFVIVKANEGTATSYDTFNEQITQAHAAGLKLGAYSYLHAGDGKVQAQAFVKSLGSWAKKIRLYADWEYFMPNQPTAADVKTLHDFLAEVKRLTGTTCGAYTSGSYKAAAGNIGASDWWLAGGNVYGNAVGFNQTGEYMGSAIWQYTSGGGVSAWPGTLDLNVSVIPEAKWYDSVGDKSLAGGNPKPSVTPPSKPKPPVSNGLPFEGKSLETLATETQKGKHGSGDDRKKNLGDYYAGVQAIVNERAKTITGNQSHQILTNETKKGVYGVNPDRKRLLGSYYNAVQALINSTPAKAPAARTYTVVNGDTLSGIGAKLKVNWQTLAKNNGIKSPYVIKPGQKLKY